MEKRIATVLGLAVLFSLCWAMPAFADENEVSALRNQIDDLNEKIATLEKKLSGVESEVRAGRPPGYVVPAAPEGGLLHLPQDINMGGHLETQWNNNFRQPFGAEGTNRLRVFDTDDGSFTINAAELYFEKPATDPGTAGFRLDVVMGEDADVVNADGDADPAADGAKFDLQQAYVEYTADVSGLPMFEGNDFLPDSINLKAGRFVTLAGAEVIEGYSNWNISRSLSFGFSIPFAHTGIRSNFKLWQDKLNVYFGINNGWDRPVDNNAYKTIEGGLGYSPFDNVSVFHALYVGKEDAPGGGNRVVWSNVVTYNVTDKLTLMGDFDIGRQGSPRLDFGKPMHWYEVALYAKYQFTDKFAMATRAELFVDESILRTAVSDHTWAQTFTAEYRLTDNLLTRGEIRWDQTNDDELIGSKQSYTTMGASLTYII